MVTGALNSSSDNSSPSTKGHHGGPPTIGSRPKKKFRPFATLEDLTATLGKEKSMNMSIVETTAAGGRDTWNGKHGSEDGKSDLEAGRCGDEVHGDEVPLNQIRVETETEVRWGQSRMR